MANGNLGFVEAGKAELEETELTIKKNTSALLAGIAGLMMMGTSSHATPVGGQQVLGAMTFSGGSLVVPVAKKKKRLRRSRTRRRGFNHRRGSFYYERPFWDDEDFYEDDYDFDDFDGDDDDDEPDSARGGDRHEEWCRRKYRSYRVRTDTWTDFDGNTRQCNSPFN